MKCGNSLFHVDGWTHERHPVTNYEHILTLQYFDNRNLFKTSTRILVLRFSRLEFSVKHRLSGKSASNVESYQTVFHTFQLPSSGSICIDWSFWKTYVGQKVGRALHMIELTGGRVGHIPCHSMLKNTEKYVLAVKMATATFPETSNSSQHFARLVPESRNCTFNHKY
jgi:hypothetical protein